MFFILRKYVQVLLSICLVVICFFSISMTRQPERLITPIENVMTIVALPGEHLVASLSGKGHIPSGRAAQYGVYDDTTLVGFRNHDGTTGGQEQQVYYGKIATPLSIQNEFGQYLMKINKGKWHDLRNNDIVVSERGYVGRVVQVSGTTSQVLLLTDATTRMHSSLYKNGAYAGMLEGTGDANTLRLTGVASEVQVGDVLTMSRIEASYPGQCVLGQVRTLVQDENGKILYAEVEPAENPLNVLVCYVVKEAFDPAEDQLGG